VGVPRELTPGEAQDMVARCGKDAVAIPIAMERGLRAVELESVHFDDDTLLWPAEIDLAARDLFVGNRRWQTGPGEEVHRQLLRPGTKVERRRAGGIEPAQQLAEEPTAGVARPTSQQRADLRPTAGRAALRSGQRLLHLPRSSGPRDVENGSGRCRDGNAVERPHLVVAQGDYTVDTDAGDAAQPGTGNVDPFRHIQAGELPQRGRCEMADGHAAAHSMCCGQHGSRGPAADREL
jgi:hypothetical protein